MRIPRLIVCLDVKDGRVVKGRQFKGLRDVGDPVQLAARYEREGADEVVFLDVSASLEERSTFLDTVTRTAEQLFVPLTVGGGIRSVDDIGRLLRAGADKVSLNSAIVRDPTLLTKAAAAFGSQCVVASIDAIRREADRPDAGWDVRTHGGTRDTELDAVEWARTCAELGAGEILLTSIDQDGARTGYDLELLRAVGQRVTVPVVASGGAANDEHLWQGLEQGASAVLLAGVLHDELTTVGRLKDGLRNRGVRVR